MRLEQGHWSERRLIQAINRTKRFRAIPYGRSKLGPEDREKMAQYWQEYALAEKYGKRPDLLIVRKRDYSWALKRLGRDPTTVGEKEFRPILRKALCGIEAENSLWVGKKMRDYGTKVPLSKLDVKSPNIWVKDQDLPCLLVWMHRYKRPVVVVQVFYDVAYAVPLLKVLRLVRKIKAARGKNRNALQKKLGVRLKRHAYFDSRIGRSQAKLVYITHDSVGAPFARVVGKVRTRARVIREKNGKIIPYVAFRGGRLRLTDEALALLGDFWKHAGRAVGGG